MNVMIQRFPSTVSPLVRAVVPMLIVGLCLSISGPAEGDSYEETKTQFQEAFSSSNFEQQQKSMRNLGSFDRKEAYKLIEKQVSSLAGRLWNIEHIFMNIDRRTLDKNRWTDQQKQVMQLHKSGGLKAMRKVFLEGAKQLRKPKDPNWLLSIIHRWGRKNPSYDSIYAIMRGKLLLPLKDINVDGTTRLLLDVLKRTERMRPSLEKQKSRYNQKIYSHSHEENLKQKRLRKPLLERKKFTRRISILDVIRRHTYKSLSGTSGEGAVRTLVQYGLTSSSEQVRAAAAYGLGFAGDSRSKDALVNHLKNETSYKVQIELLRAIGRRGIQSAETVVQSFLSDRRVPVQYAAAHVLGKVGTMDSMSVLIERMKELKSGRLFHEIDYSLALMSGEAVEAKAKAWRSWWSQNKKKSLAPPSERSVPDEKKRGEQSTKSSTEFYGVSITSNNVMFVVDASLSMDNKADYIGGGAGFEGTAAGPRVPPLPKKPTRWDVAKNQMMKAIKGLKPNQMFNIIFFAGFESIWNGNHMVPATQANKRKAFNYIQNAKLEWATAIFDALEYGFNFGTVGKTPIGEQKRLTNRMTRLAPDSIVLLSDGAPVLGQYDLSKKTGSSYNNLYQKLNMMNQFRLLKLTGISLGKKKFFQKLVNRTMNYPNPGKNPDWWIQPGVAVGR